MTSNRDDLPTRHRLFHAMVLMGGSLALRCGGEATPGPSHGSVGGSTTGGSPTSGGNPAPGGTSNTGGKLGAGGASASGAPSTGGYATGGVSIVPPPTGGKVSVDPGSFECPPAQWNCAGVPVYCNGLGFRVPEGCQCDRTRPLDSSACGAGEVFVCRDGVYTKDGQPIENPFGFECSCVAEQLSCGLACDAAFMNAGTCRLGANGVKEILCDCAVIVLR